MPPEPDAQAAQPDGMPEFVAHLQAFLDGGGHLANVNPQLRVVRHPGPNQVGPNQVVVQAPEPGPALPAPGMVGLLRRARMCLGIAVLLIVISIGQGPGAVDAPRVANAPWTGEGAVGANVLDLGAAATQITVTLHVLPKPMVAGGPAVH